MKEYSESELWVCVECGAGFDDNIGGCDSCGGGELELKKVSVPMNPFDITYKLERQWFKGEIEMVKCQTCGNDKGKPQTDNGLACGTHCNDCFEEMVSKCRSRSW